MKVTDVYVKNDHILVKVNGYMWPLVLPNSSESRRFMSEFNMFKDVNLDAGCTIANLKSIGFRKTDDDGYDYMVKNCFIDLKMMQRNIDWMKTANGKEWALLECNAAVYGLHKDLTKDVLCILNKASYDKNPNLKSGRYSGVCRAILSTQGNGITDDSVLSHVQYTMFMNDPCETVYEEWLKLTKDEEVCDG